MGDTPARSGGAWWSYRLSTVRGFAAHLHTIDPACEVPPADLLAYRPSRRTPYIYTEPEILALMAASEMLRTQHRAMTYRTLIGLLSVTGMRIGEAIRLDRGDRSGADVNARLPLLSTYLGHVNPGCTYWYLQAAPQLLGFAGERLEQHVQGAAR